MLREHRARVCVPEKVILELSPKDVGNYPRRGHSKGSRYIKTQRWETTQMVNYLPTSLLPSFILELNFPSFSLAHRHPAQNDISQPSVRTSFGLCYMSSKSDVGCQSPSGIEMQKKYLSAMNHHVLVFCFIAA